MPSPAPRTVYVFQGGGALGAYQAGFVEALENAALPPDWVVGTSIRAINAALIVGNEPGDRLKALRSFWDRVTRPGWAPHLPDTPFTAAFQTWQTLTTGERLPIGVDRQISDGPLTFARGPSFAVGHRRLELRANGLRVRCSTH